MANRAALLIERNCSLLAKAEAVRREARQMMARAQRARLECQIMQEQALAMRKPVPSQIPVAAPLNRKTTS